MMVWWFLFTTEIDHDFDRQNRIYVCEWVSEWVSEWASEWVSERESEWVCVCVCVNTPSPIISETTTQWILQEYALQMQHFMNSQNFMLF